MTPWTAACQASLSITNSWSLPKLMSTESVMPSNHFILCHPLLLLPSIFPSIRVFSNESALRIRWPKYWSFSFNIRVFANESALCTRWPKYWGFSFNLSPSNEHPGLMKNFLDPFPSPGDLSNPGLLHCRQILYQLSHKGNPGSRGLIQRSLPRKRWQA